MDPDPGIQCYFWIGRTYKQKNWLVLSFIQKRHNFNNNNTTCSKIIVVWISEVTCFWQQNSAWKYITILLQVPQWWKLKIVSSKVQTWNFPLSSQTYLSFTVKSGVVLCRAWWSDRKSEGEKVERLKIDKVLDTGHFLSSKLQAHFSFSYFHLMPSPFLFIQAH